MYRKSIAFLVLCLALLLFSAPAGFALDAGFASEITKSPADELPAGSIIFDQDSSMIFKQNTWLLWDNKVKSMKPEKKDNVIFVPLRQFVNLLGGQFKYDGKTLEATASVNGSTITAKLGSNELKTGDGTIMMDSNTQMLKGYLYIPLNGIAKAAGKALYADSTGLMVLYDAPKDTTTGVSTDASTGGPMEASAGASTGVSTNVSTGGDTSLDSGISAEVDTLTDVDAKSLKKICASLDKYFTTKAMEFKTVSVKISTGNKKANVIAINPKHPLIKITADLADTKLNNPRNFETMAKGKNAAAAVNANFISGYGPVKDPVGNLMINGKLVYGQSGITNIGFTKNRDIIFANVYTFATGSADGKKENIAKGPGKFEFNHWACYEINTLSQSQSNTILYTPERGDKVDITSDGYVAVVRNGIVKSNELMLKGTSVNIPKDGYVVYIGKSEGDKWKANLSLAVGRKVDYEYTIRSTNNEAFKWEDMDYVIAGGPDLVLDGEIQPPTTNPIFTGPKFTTLSAYRTAIGVTKDGMLLLVSVPNVKISELKEIVKGLGAWNAVNFDGGASTGMYYDGRVITKPGRELGTVLYVNMK